MIAPPPVDPRRAADVVEQLRELFREELPEWPRPSRAAWPAGDPGAALVEIFARFADITLERLNRAPEKHFLAFLDMLGVTLLPPTEARAPVQLVPAAGARGEILVRRETPLATADREPQTFETERDLWVTRSRLARALVHDPRNDRYTELSAAAGPLGLVAPAPFATFVGEALLPHLLYLGHPSALSGPRPGRVGLRLALSDPSGNEPGLLTVLGALSFWTRAGGVPARLAPSAIALGAALPGRFTASGSRLDGEPGSLDAVAVGDLLLAPFRGVFRVDGLGAGPSGPRAFVSPDPPAELWTRPVSLVHVRALLLEGTVHTGGATAPALTGVGTRFGRDLRVGDRMFLPGAGIRAVARIDGDDALQVNAPLTLDGPPGVAPWRLLPSRAATADEAWLSDDAVAVVELEDVPAGDAWALGGRASRWLWARTEAPLLGAAADLPRCTAASLSGASAAALPPDGVLANGTTIDAVKGGYPFGERPRLGDAVYLASRDGFSKPGALVTVDVDVQFPLNATATPRNVTLRWEFWSGAAWESLGRASNLGSPAPADPFRFEDGTQAFTRAGEGKIRFVCPPAAPTQVAGQDGLWIRARIASGDYGEDTKLTVRAGAPTPPTLADVIYTAPSFRPPFVSGLSVAYEHETGQPATAITVQNGFDLAAVALDETTHVPAAPFAPFPPPEDAEPSLALGWDAPLANQPVSLFAAVAEQEEPPLGPEARWQYWNGAGWARLGLARDETSSLSEPGTVELLGPTDLARSDQLGGDLYWIRAQLARGEPRLFGLSALLPNVTWARHATTGRGEIIGSSNGKPDQVFAASRAPVLEGQQLEVRELEAPPPDELALLVEKDGEVDPVREVRDEAGRVRERWIRWHEVPHFQLSRPHDRHYVVDRARGRFLFGDGKHGLVPPPGRDSVQLAEYRAGGGSAGNVAAGAISVLKRAVPSVDRVWNPFPAGGGADLEGVESVKDRGPLLLRHRGRAVTAEDYEALAREASRQVARAKCLPARDAATAGKVAVLIVPEGGPRPLPTPGLLRRVQAFLDARRLPTADLALLGPSYVDVSISAEVVPTSFDDAEAIRRRVGDALTAWLHPLTGGPQARGWDFGRDVYLSEVAQTIEGVAGVDHLARATLSGRAGADDRTRDGGRRIEVRAEAGELVASGTHTVVLATS